MFSQRGWESMEFWFFLLAFLCFFASLLSFLGLFKKNNLPPGPPTIPFLGNFLWLLRSSNNFSDLEPVLHQLRSKYGSIVTLHLGSRPAIFVTTPDAAHRVLVKNAALFASRPSAIEASTIFLSNQCTVTSAPYGSLWRFLRANFLSITQPSKLKFYSDGRKWTMTLLKKRLMNEAELGKTVSVMDHLQFGLFALLSFMCFGEKYNEETIAEIEAAERATISNFIRFNVLNFLPRLGKIVFRKRWKELLEIRENQMNVVLPLIKSRRKKLMKQALEDEEKRERERIVFYIDSLFDLRIAEGGRKFTDEELVSLVSEFLLGGTDTTASTLLWIMANLVKYQNMQQKVLDEIQTVVKPEDEIEEDDLRKLPYLNAVVMESLRRHPPAHFILPRAVTEDTVIDGYDIPKEAIVNFTVAEFGWDPNVWEDPMEFKPERFLSKEGEEVEVDLKGTREIKMMPFGAGRRVCPAIEASLLHLKYFVANFIREFQWRAENGGEVDMTEKQVFTIVMKNPLRVKLSARSK